MSKNELQKVCPYCGGKGKVDKPLFMPVSKMQKLIKKYKFTQSSLSRLLGISQSCVNNWMNPKTNLQGIKKKYFEQLKKKGYE